MKKSHVCSLLETVGSLGLFVVADLIRRGWNKKFWRLDPDLILTCKMQQQMSTVKLFWNASLAWLMAFYRSSGFDLGTDGASVIYRKTWGLCTKLKERFQNLISWQCFNHRLQLAVHDAVKACTKINHFKIFREKLYTIVFPQRDDRALENCAAQV